MDGRRHAASPAPSDGELLAALQQLIPAEPLPPGHSLEIVSRRRNEYTSSSQSEIVTVRQPLGACRELLVKYARDMPDPEPRCRQGIEYCDRVYRQLVARLPISHLTALGMIYVGDPAVTGLVIDHLSPCLRVSEAPNESGIIAAAEWCGLFHRFGGTIYRDGSLTFLVRYDRAHYRAWAARAMAIAAAAGGPPAWLTRLCAAFEEKCELLADAAATTIHGEFGPQNVLWQEGIIYPVDWESAAIGPGEIDLATLLFNWPADVVDRCIAAYWRVRGEPRPKSFAVVWDAATLFTALRWLPDIDGPRGNAAGTPGGEPLRQSLAMLERTGQSLRII
jgi:hypothetical protein